MIFEPPLSSGILVRRYKRFLADIQLEDGEIKTIHCPNTGSMKNCANPGDRVWYSTSTNPKRKYADTWELNETLDGDFIGINTLRANQLVRAAIETDLIPTLMGYGQLQAEVKYGQENSRIDLLLSEHPQQSRCYVEVKSVTLCEQREDARLGYFPDSVSDRGRKHLRELMDVVAQGYRGVLVYCVQHTKIREVRPALHIDPAYSHALQLAQAAGVEVLAFRATISARHIQLAEAVPVSMIEML
ncbi:MAG: sugar fermentation stimulation protein A [Candidatus Azotimanducaceae bacterium]